MTDRSAFPRIIWLLWLQGWDVAPQVALAGRASWEGRNPGWRVNALDRGTLGQFLPGDILDRIFAAPKEPEALSDRIRLELLSRYGGVWADATTVCARPLDDWLPSVMPNGFFAFARPGPDRMIATWFLAAEKGSHVIETWRAAAWRYWHDRTSRDDYFWVHRLFAVCHATDRRFRVLWDGTPQMSAVHRFHFGPSSLSLLQAAPADVDALLRDPPAPVFKLTHKLGSAPADAGSLMERLLSFATAEHQGRPPACRRILVAWFGSFDGHGTIGDLRSLEAVVSHLVGRGHDVRHATAAELAIPGAARVKWDEVAPEHMDLLLFVCGPILKRHPETGALFARFAAGVMAGLGVSILPADDPNFLNPFRKVFARQGLRERYGDVAIVAPKGIDLETIHRGNDAERRKECVIGVCLRGNQGEYGAARCKAAEVATLFEQLSSLVVRHGNGRILEIENQLRRAAIPADEIEKRYEQCDLVLTSRFHGAMMAMRAGVPFIAIDQIAGGAKVEPLLRDLGWRSIYRVDAVNALAIVRDGLDLIVDPRADELARACETAIREANRTLERLDHWLETLTP